MSSVRFTVRTIGLASALAFLLTLDGPSVLASSTAPDPVPYPLVRGLPDEHTRFRGLVADDVGRPIAGARVAVQTGLVDTEVTTDAAGRFDLALSTASPVARCIVSAAGKGLFIGKWVAVEPGRGADLGTIELRPAASIAGQIADGAGARVPWAWIEIDGTEVFGADWEVAARLLGVHIVDCHPTDGTFVIATLPPGNYQIAGRAVGHEVEEARVAAPTSNVRLGAKPFSDGPRLDIDTFLSPPDGAEPGDEIVVETAAGTVRGRRMAVSMESEFVRFPVSLPCRLVYAGGRWNERVEIALDRVPHGPLPISIRPKRPSASALGGDVSIRGVVELGGVPLAWHDGFGGVLRSGYRCRVEAFRHSPREADDGPSSRADTLTQPDGSFQFEGLLRGTYVLRATVEESFGDPVDAPIGPEYMVSVGKGPVRVPMRARSNPELAVHVPDSVRSAPDFRLEATAARGATNFQCVVAADRVTVRGVPPGRFEVAVRARANGLWSRRVVVAGDTVTPLATATIPVGRRISGRVLSGGSPVPGARVEIRPDPDTGTGGDVVCTDAEGRFAVVGLDATSAWSVSARASVGYGYAPVTAGESSIQVFLVPWPARYR
ncbi:MAG: hypothetical protein HMLKMBBP_01651 [Planctomycetes bacterium]|nr:hypothetical protein [Planctomycetota bacterium]